MPCKDSRSFRWFSASLVKSVSATTVGLNFSAKAPSITAAPLASSWWFTYSPRYFMVSKWAKYWSLTCGCCTLATAARLSQVTSRCVLFDFAFRICNPWSGWFTAEIMVPQISCPVDVRKAWSPSTRIRLKLSEHRLQFHMSSTVTNVSRPPANAMIGHFSWPCSTAQSCFSLREGRSLKHVRLWWLSISTVTRLRAYTPATKRNHAKASQIGLLDRTQTLAVNRWKQQKRKCQKPSKTIKNICFSPIYFAEHLEACSHTAPSSQDHLCRLLGEIWQKFKASQLTFNKICILCQLLWLHFHMLGISFMVRCPWSTPSCRTKLLQP